MKPGTKVTYQVQKSYVYAGKSIQRRTNTVTGVIVKVDGPIAFVKTGNGALKKIEASRLTEAL